jgi:hypothetical protein
VVGGGWLAYSGIHFIWRMFHLSAFPTVNRAGAVVSLSLIVVFSLLPMLPDRSRRAAEAP